MSRFARKVDANQPQVVDELERVAGVSVQSLASVGNGVVDLLVGFRGVNWLFELKDPNKPPSARKLTPDQLRWHAAWRGQKAVVETSEEILTIIGATPPRPNFTKPHHCHHPLCCAGGE